MVEQTAVNRKVAGSNPATGAICITYEVIRRKDSYCSILIPKDIKI